MTAENNTDIKTLSPLTLAYLGDSVFELLVRERIIYSANRSVNDLHNAAIKIVSAPAQCSLFDKIEPLLSDEQINIYKRGRNAKVGSAPKHCSISEYHKATGFEALIGYLYLTKQGDLLEEIVDTAFCGEGE